MGKFNFLLAMAGMAIFLSCEMPEDEEEQRNEYELAGINNISAETTADYTNTYFGLYKGIIAGPKSSGTVRIEINHGNDDTKALIVIGSETFDLTYTSAVIKNKVTNDEKIYTYPESLPQLTSDMSASIDLAGDLSYIRVYINYIIDDMGRLYYCTIDESLIHIEGHDDLQTEIRKETRNNIVSCFEGSCVDSKGTQGAFNMIYDKRYGFFSYILCGENTGMYVHSFIAFLRENYTQSGSRNYWGVQEAINGSKIEFDMKITTIDSNNISGTWKTKWPKGSNNGTFTCNVPLKKLS